MHQKEFIGANVCYCCAMIRTNFYYSEETMERLRVLRGATGIPMSTLVRNAIDRYLDTEAQHLVRLMTPAQSPETGSKKKGQSDAVPTR